MNTVFLEENLVKNGPIDKLIFFEEIDSTNKFSKQYISENPSADNILILTSNQTNGTGRFNRKWFSSPGQDLTFTLIKKFKLNVDEVHRVNFYSSYILYFTLMNFFKNKSEMIFSLKWPNDLLLNGLKLSGFLTEIKDINNSVKTFMIGCGINVNQDSFDNSISGNSTSIKNNSSEEINNEQLLLEYIKNYYSEIILMTDSEKLLNLWKSGTEIIGKEIRFKKYNDDNSETAVISDIDNDGALCLRNKTGVLKKYYSGEITLNLQ